MQELDLKFENIAYVEPPYNKGELAHIVCIDEKPEYKHREYFLNENMETVAYFEFEHGNVEQMSKYYQNIFILNEETLNEPNTNEKIVRVEPDGSKTVLGVYEEVEYGEDDGTIKVLLNGKWGFINLLGEVIIEPQYGNRPWGFLDGYCIIKENDGKSFIINKKNEIVFRNNNRFISGIRHLGNGMFYIKDTFHTDKFIKV